MRKVPTIVLSITYKGVKFIDAANKVGTLTVISYPETSSVWNKPPSKELTESWMIFPVRCLSCLCFLRCVHIDIQSNCSAQYYFVCFCFASYFNSSRRLSYLCRTSSPNMKSGTSLVRPRTQRTCARLPISLKTCRPATTTATSSAPWTWWGNVQLWYAHHKSLYSAQWRSRLLILCSGKMQPVNSSSVNTMMRGLHF